MAHQEEGWPLGLQPVNMRVGLGGRGREVFGSVSFNTMLTQSSDSSSDLDTESTGSFFHDRSITLGSLMGVSSLLELSRRSIRGRRRQEPLKAKKPFKSRTWFLSLCSRDSTDVRDPKNASSLGHFLAVERRASSNMYGRPRNSNACVAPSEVPMNRRNSLFLNGEIAPPQAGSDSGGEQGMPVLLSCVCGQAAH